MYCTPDLTPTLLAFDVLATDEVRELSDHALLLARFDLDVLRRVLTPPADTSTSGENSVLINAAICNFENVRHEALHNRAWV
jgi:hypothetical protein